MMKRTALWAAFLSWTLVACSPLSAAEPTVEARNGMVASVSPEASDAGVDILRKGGNAVDAAVATAFALTVTYPQAGNIGGGGFMLVYPTKAAPTVIEYRETAPAAATVDMFVKQTNTYQHNVVGVPGTVRGLALAHERFGKLPWKDLVQPAIRLAEGGFQIDSSLAKSLNDILLKPEGFPELVRVYGKSGGKEKWQAGDKLVQPDLAKTLRLIAENGADAFYTGPIADQIVAEMKSGGGLITKDDLAHYQAHERKPIHGTYRGYDIYAPPLPSSGGICLTEMLNILENFDLRNEGRFSAKTCHLLSEAMQRAYCDRARYLGDDSFVEIPKKLTTKEYARELAKSIPLDHATKSEELAKDIPLAKESDNTTHFSVIDRDGMAVANTYTLEHSYGSKIVVRGAGFLLNNQMSDFNWKPGVTNRKGQIGTLPNQIAPGKR
ncbi:MAG TPA: gamma-glutamyltransferase, partial [Gemmataceae bacterium]|nr:gamma-glutamyltransferase [Gemmataceae bacterium]